MKGDFLYNEILTHKDMWDTCDGSTLDFMPFVPLIKGIMTRHALTAKKIKSFSKATNAVFEVDGTILKIFVPHYYDNNYFAEIFGLNHAIKQGVSVPKLIAHGVFKDSYDFHYIVQEKINGQSLRTKLPELSENQQATIGNKIFHIIKKLNIPVKNFHEENYFDVELNSNNWLRYSSKFQQERLEYLSEYIESKPTITFVHSDLHLNNILIDENNEPVIIDFGECKCAPTELELPALLFSAIEFPALFKGFTDNFDINELVRLTFTGNLLQYGMAKRWFSRICDNPDEIWQFYEKLQEYYVKMY